MIVCHCNIITDKDIINLIDKGAKTLQEIQCGCDACKDCEGCKNTILDILSENDKIRIDPEKNK